MNLARALRIAARGWPVLPTLNKAPIGALVPRGHHDATTDEQTIRAWWASHPDAIPAVALEAAGIVALDAEGPEKDPQGMPTLRALLPELTDTTTQNTPSGGAHLLYRRTADDQARRLIRPRPGIDLLGKGYVAVYEDIEGDPAPLPDALVNIFHEKPVQVRSEAVVEGDFPPASWDLLAYAHRLAMAHGPKAKGQGGNQHAYALGALLLNDLALTLEEATPIVFAWKEAFAETRGWRDDYLLETVSHGARYATSARGARRADLGVLEVAKGVEASADPGWEAALLRAKAELDAYRGTGEAAVGKLSRPAFSPATDLLTREFPPTPWLIQGLVTEMSVGVTSAEPKSIKTWIELENALAVATGTPSLGEFITGTPRAVALFLAEDDARAARNRLKALCAARGLDPEVALKHVHVCCRQHLDLTNDTDLVWILASCQQIEGLALVVLDPLRDVHAAEENDSTGMADVMGRLRAIRDIVRCSVRAPHHAKKESSGRSDRGGQNMRGSSAIHGALDCGLYLDGLDTDGKSRWSVRATAEIKAARGAGTFGVTLEVEDNAAGEAMGAKWTVERGTAKSVTKKDLVEHEVNTRLSALLQLLDSPLIAGGSLGINQIAKKVGGGKPLESAIELAANKKLIARRERGRQALGWGITEAGRAWLKSPPDAPSA